MVFVAFHQLHNKCRIIPKIKRCLPVQSFSGDALTFEKEAEDGKGKCPFDPFQRYASIMAGR